MFTGFVTLTGIASSVNVILLYVIYIPSFLMVGVETWMAFIILAHIVSIMRIIACLSIMGLTWPKLREGTTQHAPLSGMTTLGADTTLVGDQTVKSSLTCTLSRINEKFKRKTSVIVSETATVQVVSYQDRNSNGIVN